MECWTVRGVFNKCISKSSFSRAVVYKRLKKWVFVGLLASSPEWSTGPSCEARKKKNNNTLTLLRLLRLPAPI